MKKRLFFAFAGLAIIAVLILACQVIRNIMIAYKLENGLYGKLAEVYELYHPIISDSVPPADLIKELEVPKYSEAKLFLHLPLKYQLYYLQKFWDWHGGSMMKQEYLERAKVAYSYCFTENRIKPLRTDRAWVMLICGFPMDISVFVVEESEEIPFANPRIVGQPFVGNEMSNEWDEDKKLVEIWTYHWSQSGTAFGNITKFYFYHRTNGRWELNSSTLSSQQREFIEYSKERFRPDRDAWKEIIAALWPHYQPDKSQKQIEAERNALKSKETKK